ncbi:hypothetical protein EJB05_47002, partial [Eragrostis curvula]
MELREALSKAVDLVEATAAASEVAFGFSDDESVVRCGQWSNLPASMSIHDYNGEGESSFFLDYTVVKSHSWFDSAAVAVKISPCCQAAGSDSPVRPKEPSTFGYIVEPKTGVA